MVTLYVMRALRRSCNTGFDILEKLDDTKGVAKVLTGIVSTRNDRVGNIKNDSKSHQILAVWILLPLEYYAHTGSNQHTKAQKNLGDGSVHLAAGQFISWQNDEHTVLEKNGFTIGNSQTIRLVVSETSKDWLFVLPGILASSVPHILNPLSSILIWIASVLAVSISDVVLPFSFVDRTIGPLTFTYSTALAIFVKWTLICSWVGVTKHVLLIGCKITRIHLWVLIGGGEPEVLDNGCRSSCGGRHEHGLCESSIVTTVRIRACHHHLLGCSGGSSLLHLLLLHHRWLHLCHLWVWRCRNHLDLTVFFSVCHI